MATLYASFADKALAEQAAGALLDHGLHNEDISLVSHHEPDTPARGNSLADEPPTANDVADYGIRGGERSGDSTYMAYGGAGPRIVETGDRAPAGPGGALMNAETGPGFTSARELNEAAEGAGLEDAPYLEDAGTRPDDLAPAPGGRSGTEQADRPSAESGISVTTPQDAASGAVKGAGLGLGVGALAALASLFIPGVGLVIGGGALAAALGGTALATGAGAVAGGVTGYLKDQGVSEQAASRFAGAVESGGAVLSVRVSPGVLDQAEARSILEKYGARDIHAVAA